MMEEYAKDNFFAQYDNHSYHCCRNLIYPVDLCQGYQSIKCRSRPPGHKACWNSIPRTIILQGLPLTAMTAAENIRIYYEYEGKIEKSVQRITVWHHEACRVMTNGDLEGQIFLSYPHKNNGFFFLLTTVFYIEIGLPEFHN